MSIDKLRETGFDVEATNHAEAILVHDFPAELGGLCDILLGFRIMCWEMLQSGGGEAELTKRLGDTLSDRGWKKRKIEVEKLVDKISKTFTTHEIDHVLETRNGRLALEIEWNNKDLFFDRDLENFQRLHSDGAISVGMIITRGRSLHSTTKSIFTECAKRNELTSLDDFHRLGIKELTVNQKKLVQKKMKKINFETAVAEVLAGKYGESTTHWKKLGERIDRGVGNPCPLLLLGLPSSCVEIRKKIEE